MTRLLLGRLVKIIFSGYMAAFGIYRRCVWCVHRQVTFPLDIYITFIYALLILKTAIDLCATLRITYDREIFGILGSGFVSALLIKELGRLDNRPSTTALIVFHYRNEVAVAGSRQQHDRNILLYHSNIT